MRVQNWVIEVGAVAMMVVVALGLSACNYNPNRDANEAYVKYEIAADGCNVKAIENPRGPNFFIAKCPGESVTTTHQQQNGKSQTTIPVVTTQEVDDLKKKLAEVQAKQSALDKLSAEDKKALGIK